ncbi:glycosyltransferase involved in cell wall biosynthesis [Catalinimonas alkaloidigena]|uniref:glycosyltransferase family 4 protein n=1 Tax=Catalinimonas alkaloidigena TaxID=1075417 RepID=UPI0024070C23|nr:glycosyltransferase family 4 protein [Catalinimonas alkaloidigena]MDF9795011.1 glycosyltransferase involved in cell wall biosynthesis [Catalinimonas alkaloidigena]
MHILYIHQYFRTPEEGGAIRSYYLAKGMVDAGHHVDLVTAYKGDRYKKEFIDGIHVHYLPVSYDQNFTFFQRIKAFLSFVVLACIKISAFEKIDVCYVSSTPLTTGLIALFLKWKFRIPYYFEVRDLWPEAPIQMKVVRKSWLKYQLYSLEKKIYHNAEAIIALSADSQRHISTLVPHKEVALVPNIADCKFFRKAEKNTYHEAQFDVKGKFVVSYFGAVGEVNQLEYLLEAAEACKKQMLLDVVFLIAGVGNRLETIRQKAATRNLDNVRFVPYHNKYGLLSLLNITDAAYISFADVPVLKCCSPNKLFDALAAGKLCVTNISGWMKELLEGNQCGFYANPHYPDEFVKKIAPFVNDRSLLDNYQSNARNLAEQEFDRQLLVDRLLVQIEKEQAEKVAKAYTLPV